MCYEESFFQRWARNRARRREKSAPVVEREKPKQPAQPAPVPTAAAEAKKSTQPERDVEVV